MSYWHQNYTPTPSYVTTSYTPTGVANASDPATSSQEVTNEPTATSKAPAPTTAYTAVPPSTNTPGLTETPGFMGTSNVSGASGTSGSDDIVNGFLNSPEKNIYIEKVKDYFSQQSTMDYYSGLMFMQNVESYSVEYPNMVIMEYAGKKVVPSLVNARYERGEDGIVFKFDGVTAKLY